MKEISRNTKIFISYSRKDKLFVRKLNDAIKSAGIDSWVDWEGIPLSSDWMKEITTAIEGSDAFIFVISPDSIKSQYCIEELELGIKNNKKILPVLYREPEKRHKLHPKLASTNWVYLRSKKDDFKSTLPKLNEAILTDFGWVQQHTRLLQRATEWIQKDRNNNYLLQGPDLEDGEHWMTESTAGQGRNATPLQAEYINTSRMVSVRRQRNFTIGVGAALVISVLLGIYTLTQSIEARKSRDKAELSERARATQQAVAEEQKLIAEQNAQKANAQRSAAQAKIYQDRAGELHTSTLLALNAFQLLPDFADAENILRHNISLLPIPINQMNVNARIWTIQPSPDQKKFVTADSDGKACLWNIENGAQIFCVQNDGIVYDTVMSEDGKILVTGTEKGVVAFWDANTGKPIKSLQFNGTIWDLNMHPGGHWLGVGRSDAVSIINMNNLSEEFFFRQNGEVKTIDFDKSGVYMAFGTSKGYTTIWTVMTNHSVAGPKHTGEVFDLIFSPDSKWLISVGADSSIRAALTATGGQKYSVTNAAWVEDITFGPDSDWFVTVSDDDTVRVIDTASGQEKLRMAHTNFVQKVRVSKDGQWIATTGYDKTLRLWDSGSGAEVMQIPINGIGSSIRFNKNATRLIVGDNNGEITLWDISQLKVHTGSIKFTEYLHKALFSPDGKWLAVNSDDKNIWLINSDELGNQVDNRKILTTANGLTYDMAISPDSKWIAAVEYDNNIVDYNRVILISVDGDKKFFLTHAGAAINTISFTADNKQIITADKNGLINIWNVASGEKVQSINSEGIILSLAVSPNGQYLIAGVEAGNHSIVWDLKTLAQVTTLNQAGRINVIQFSKDGKLLVTGSSEGTVKLWKVADGSFSPLENELLVDGEVLSLNFSPDNKQLAVGDSTGYVYLFDPALGQELARLRQIDKVSSVSFSADGKTLATVARKIVSLWDLNLVPQVQRAGLIEYACAHLITNFSENQWKQLFFDEKYRLICPNLPAGEN